MRLFTDCWPKIIRMAAEEMEPMKGLHQLCEWIEDQGLKRAAVTNAPRPNAVQLISSLGLSGFFETIVIGSECDQAKPFPDPYLTALSVLGVSHEHAFVFEVRLLIDYIWMDKMSLWSLKFNGFSRNHSICLF